MKRKNLLCSIIVIAVACIIVSLSLKFFNLNDNRSDSWIGSYSFFEFAEPNQNMDYSITIYEDNGLYARIRIDGFSTMQRLTAQVWSHDDEIKFTFYDYYTDENGHSSIPKKYDKGISLLALKKEDGVLITKWYIIQPMLPVNREAGEGQYFTKDK